MATENPYQPTWDDPLGPNAWSDINWPGQEAMHAGLVMLVALDHMERLRCVGTGFIVSAQGRFAICATAAHVFYSGVSNAQNPVSRRAASALPEFIAGFESVAIDNGRLHAIYRHADRIVGCRVVGVTWDKQTDTAFFDIETPDPRDDDFVQGEWVVDGSEPKVGDFVGVVGYAQMEATPVDHPDGLPAGEIQSQLLVRVGRVTELNEGGIFVRTRCAETSIPVFGGMSGGPAFLWQDWGKPPTAFGFISSDPESDVASKHDFSEPGRSSIVMLNASTEVQGPVRFVQMNLRLDALVGSLRAGWRPTE